MNTPLPPLIRLSDYGGNWNAYVEAIYRVYLDEVVHGDLMFRGWPIKVQYRPESHGKHFGFWHLISEGAKEDERNPDLRRCERIRWIAWTIREAETNDAIRWWENRRHNNTHVVLWLYTEDFAVVLAKRKGYYLLKTAYVVAQHRKNIFEKEWGDFRGKG